MDNHISQPKEKPSEAQPTQDPKTPAEPHPTMDGVFGIDF
jgi:hypothetical protein